MTTEEDSLRPGEKDSDSEGPATEGHGGQTWTTSCLASYDLMVVKAFQIVVCTSCQKGLFSYQVVKHIRSHKEFKNDKRATSILECKIKLLLEQDLLCDTTVTTLGQETKSLSAVIPGIRLESGFRCSHSECFHSTRAASSMLQHHKSHRDEHNRMIKGLSAIPCTLQQLPSTNSHFTVIVPDQEMTDGDAFSGVYRDVLRHLPALEGAPTQFVTERSLPQYVIWAGWAQFLGARYTNLESRERIVRLVLPRDDRVWAKVLEVNERYLKRVCSANDERPFPVMQRYLCMPV